MHSRQYTEILFSLCGSRSSFKNVTGNFVFSISHYERRIFVKKLVNKKRIREPSRTSEAPSSTPIPALKYFRPFLVLVAEPGDETGALEGLDCDCSGHEKPGS